jgi:hypothetical protein
MIILMQRIIMGMRRMKMTLSVLGGAIDFPKVVNCVVLNVDESLLGYTRLHVGGFAIMQCRYKDNTVCWSDISMMPFFVCQVSLHY